MFRESVVLCLRQYGRFRGRASRAEFWGWVVSVAVVWLVLMLAWSTVVIVMELLSGQFKSGRVVGILVASALQAGLLLGLATIIPTLAVTSRRLHDTGRRGWLQAVWYGVPVPLWLLWGFVAAWSTLQGLVGNDPSPIPFFTTGILALVATVTMGVWALRVLSQPGDPFGNQYGKPQNVDFPS